MSRIEWLIWVVRYGNPRRRATNLTAFFFFEFYSLYCRLNGHKLTHFLDQEPLPAGKYILQRQTLPPGVKLLVKIFPTLQKMHVDHIPYSPEVLEEMKRAGKVVEMVTIFYELRVEGSSK